MVIERLRRFPIEVREDDIIILRAFDILFGFGTTLGFGVLLSGGGYRANALCRKSAEVSRYSATLFGATSSRCLPLPRILRRTNCRLCLSVRIDTSRQRRFFASA